MDTPENTKAENIPTRSRRAPNSRRARKRPVSKYSTAGTFSPNFLDKFKMRFYFLFHY